MNNIAQAVRGTGVRLKYFPAFASYTSTAVVGSVQQQCVCVYHTYVNVHLRLDYTNSGRGKERLTKICLWGYLKRQHPLLELT